MGDILVRGNKLRSNGWLTVLGGPHQCLLKWSAAELRDLTCILAGSQLQGMEKKHWEGEEVKQGRLFINKRKIVSIDV